MEPVRKHWRWVRRLERKSRNAETLFNAFIVFKAFNKLHCLCCPSLPSLSFCDFYILQCRRQNYELCELVSNMKLHTIPWLGLKKDKFCPKSNWAGHSASAELHEHTELEQVLCRTNCLMGSDTVRVTRTTVLTTTNVQTNHRFQVFWKKSFFPFSETNNWLFYSFWGTKIIFLGSWTYAWPMKT